MKTRLLVSFTALLIIAGCASEIVSKRIQVDVTAEDVWQAVVTDLNTWGKWDPTIDEWLLESEGELGEGSFTKYWIGKNWATMRATEYEPSKKIAYELVETNWPAKKWDYVITLEEKIPTHRLKSVSHWMRLRIP